MEAIALSAAVLCADCEMVTAATNGHCPVCGGRALQSLAKVLHGGLGPQEERQRVLEAVESSNMDSGRRSER